MNGYVVLAGVFPLAACASLLVVSLLAVTDWYRPARRVLGALLIVACASLLACVGLLAAMTLA